MNMEENKSQLVNDYAIENFKNGLNCAESVYDALLRAGVLVAVSVFAVKPVVLYRLPLWQTVLSMAEKIPGVSIPRFAVRKSAKNTTAVITIWSVNSVKPTVVQPVVTSVRHLKIGMEKTDGYTA